MAKTWGFTEEQHRRFEAAATALRFERGAVYDMFAAGEIPPEELAEQLTTADSIDTEELREALGKHYQEYTLMRGHFAEAGLDKKPFEPPVYDATPSDPDSPKRR